jgi:hypothetical protein
MNWNTFFGVTATVCLFFPVATILYYRLFKHRSLTALMIAYLSTGIYSLMQSKLISVTPQMQKGFGVVNDYLNIPLMLTALLFFCPVRQRQRAVHLITWTFICYELLIAFTYGLSPDATIYIMGPGLALVLLYSFYLFARHIKVTIEFGKNAGRTLMLVSILFTYVCYGIVYHFYYIQQTPDVADAFLVYFVSSIVASMLMTAGLTQIRKRMKELEEIKNTRRELAIFFNT